MKELDFNDTLTLGRNHTHCVDCGAMITIDSFRDEEAMDEFRETGLCQACLDLIPDIEDDDPIWP